MNEEKKNLETKPFEAEENRALPETELGEVCGSKSNKPPVWLCPHCNHYNSPLADSCMNCGYPRV